MTLNATDLATNRLDVVHDEEDGCLPRNPNGASWSLRSVPGVGVVTRGWKP